MTAYGLDFSLTSTGLASFDGDTWDTATIRTTPVDSSPGSFLSRVDHIAAKAVSWMDPHEGDVICIEGPALHAKSSQLDRMFGAWWLLMKAITDHAGEPWIIPPAVVKQIATGKGNAGKDEVLIAMLRRFPSAPISGNDTADACALAVAATHIGGVGIPMPKPNLAGLTKMLGAQLKEMP